MIIGVPKEIKLQEHRIGLTPDSVKALIDRNHEVLIENNGGFSSIQLNLEDVKTANNQIIELQLKGDGSLFQFRIKAAKYDRHSYVYDFKTTGQWETILIPLKDMLPSYRGYKLNIKNFDHSYIDRIGFLKASKKNSAFQLEIKSIALSNNL